MTGAMAMFDDFFIRALLAGTGLALIAGPTGCFIVWRRMAYFGDTMSHSALLGVAMAFFLDVPLMAGVFVIALLVSLGLVFLQKRQSLPADSLLGILSHATLATGLVAVSFMTWVRIDLMGLLFGDILAVTWTDIAVIYAAGTIIATSLFAVWRPLLAATVSEDLAAVEGLNPDRARLVFMVLVASIIAMAMKIAGIILITALLIIPAATARRFSSTPEHMAMLASLAGVIAVIAGMFASLQYDTPSGPSIVVAAFVLFTLSLLPLPGHQKE